MKPKSDELRELDAVLSVFRLTGGHCRPEAGWLRQMRQAVGLSAEEVGRRAGMTERNVRRAEAREVQGTIGMEVMRRLAEALECELVYAFVPKQGSLEAMAARQETKEREAEEAHRRRWRASAKYRAEVRERVRAMMAEMNRRGR